MGVQYLAEFWWFLYVSLLFLFSFSFFGIFSFGNSKIIIFVSGQEPSRSSGHRLSKPLVGEDGRIYACSEKDLFAFESNGTIEWTIHLDYTCNAAMAPVQGGLGKVSNFFFFFFFGFMCLVSDSMSLWLLVCNFLTSIARVLDANFKFC